MWWGLVKCLTYQMVEMLVDASFLFSLVDKYGNCKVVVKGSSWVDVWVELMEHQQVVGWGLWWVQKKANHSENGLVAYYWDLHWGSSMADWMAQK